jgi:nitrate reductase cytochrome c-type subunit
MGQPTAAVVVAWGVSALALAYAGTAACTRPQQSRVAEAVAEVDAGPPIVGPREFWERAVPHQAVPEGLTSLSAAECARCHPANHAEWSGSAHAHAFTDVQYQREWARDKHLWLCRNCHTPLQNQQPTIVRGTYGGEVRKPAEEPNPNYDPELEKEGINCASCHVRDGTVLSPRESGLPAPHPVKVDPQALSRQACLNCHNAMADLGGALICTFDTGDDWGSTELPAAGVDCLSCHMPPVMRELDGGVIKRGAVHTFLGAGIPKVHVEGAVGRSGLVVKVHPAKGGYRRGQQGTVAVSVENLAAGHTVPTGDVERFVSLRFRLLDEKGQEHWTHEERFGEVWKWWPKPERVSETSIRRGERRDLSLEIPLPERIGRAQLEVSLSNHRMVEKNAVATGIPDWYPRGVPVWTERYPLKLLPR